jgi:hypothetical protein
MQTATRLAAFTAGIAAVGGVAAAIGSATGANPPGAVSAARTASSAMAMAGGATAAVVPGADGTSLSAGGMTLQPTTIRVAARKQTTWTFRIVDSHGQVVRRLVALHAGDLAYSHVHPTGKDLAHGSITFDTELHKAGPYRLFLQFRTGGRVHTAAFTQNVGIAS